MILICLCLALCFICGPVKGESTKKESSAKTSPMSYQEALTAFEKIKEGMGQKEVRKLLGAPDRATGKDPDNTRYDEEWIYDFRKSAGYPKENATKAVWEGHIYFLDGKVLHTRRIGFLGRR